jgi:hypothetical protein
VTKVPQHRRGFLRFVTGSQLLARRIQKGAALWQAKRPIREHSPETKKGRLSRVSSSAVFTFPQGVRKDEHGIGCCRNYQTNNKSNGLSAGAPLGEKQ